MRIEDTYFSDSDYLRKLGVEVMLPIPFSQVIGWMNKAVFNPVLLRPTFDRLRLSDPRMFETAAANTIPLFGLDEGTCGRSTVSRRPRARAAGRQPPGEDLGHREPAGALHGRRHGHQAASHRKALARGKARELIEIVES